jgi:hypothetical protein
MRNIRRFHQAAGVLSITIAASVACNPPSGPQPLPPQQATEYRVSGIVRNEDGRAVANASVSVAADPGAFPDRRTTTQADGQYEFLFSQVNPPPPVIVAFGDEDGSTIRLLDWTGQNSIVKDLRLRRVRMLTAGESMTTTIDADSSLCSWEYSSSITTLCEWFIVATPAGGTLTVEARVIGDGGVPPRLGWDNPGQGATLTMNAQSVGSRFWLNLAIPAVAAPQRYLVTTSLK